LSISFVTPEFGSLSQVAMAAALKVFTRGTLTFFEIAIVILFIASLAAIAALDCIRVRKRNRPSEVSGMLFDQLNPGTQRGLIAVIEPGLSPADQHFMLLDVHQF
jgi:hypothetical protein